MQHYSSRLQGWASFTGLYKEAIDRLPSGSVMVEIGCWKGKSAAFAGVEIINSRKAIKFYTVDHFKGAPNHADRPEIVSGELEAIARANLAPVAKAVTILAMSSVEAAATFADGTVDVLFVDGTHDYASVKADLLAWRPKLKPGALVAGDDANWRGVKEAAREVIGEIEVLLEGTKKAHWRAVAPIGQAEAA
jgi:hypothetical protein